MSKAHENATVRGCSELVVGVVLGLLACLLISLCACKPQKELVTEKVEVPVVVTQEHHTESVRVDVVRDTIRQRDSIYHYIKGDTTIIERWHYYTTNNNVVRVDTLIRVDSVQVPVEVVRTKEVTKIEEVEKPLHWWQKCLMWLGVLSLIGVCGVMVWKIRHIAR